jgi:Asp-tRNA(Asn)/Glu-tRNA(Gln) amidotransferase A subunit family amidase
VDSFAALDALGQAELVRRREVTPRELVEWSIERIEKLNPSLNAVVTPLYDRALARTDRVAGPFAGVPYLIKDLIVEVAGTRFTEGSAFLRDHMSTVDSTLVTRLEKSGLVIVGKTNTPEFGMVPTCEPTLHGPTRNPWDPARSTSGSSGGSASAVAARMVAAAHGNDLGGSLRYPAAACGLFGLKPTRGRVSLAPLYGDAVSGWAAEHALTRSVRDSAALLDATAWIVDYWVRRLGREPGLDELEPLTRTYRELGQAVDAATYLHAVEVLQRYSRRVAGFLAGFDGHLTPTLSQPPLLLGEITSTDDDPLRALERGGTTVDYPQVIANITGNPAMSLPLYWNAAGLPIGVHVLGRFGDEATLFRLAAQLEQARPWVGRTPSLARASVYPGTDVPTADPTGSRGMWSLPS